jgi:hypothetical protein
MANEKPKDTDQTSLNEGAEGGKHGGGKAAAPKLSPEVAAELESFKAQLQAQLLGESRQVIAQMQETFRNQLNEEREMLHAQVDAAKADADQARHQLRNVAKPADANTLLLQEPLEGGPSRRKAARPLPSEGIVELELTHGSFVGETMDRTFWNREVSKTEPAIGALVRDNDSFEPARPGAVLRFDMKKPKHAKTAQMLRDSGCAERI